MDQPSVDELFPEQPKSVDELFPPQIEKDRYRRETLGTSPIQDLIFGDTTVNPIARVLDQFGQGFKQSWGAGDQARISKETEDYLKVNKQFDAWNEGQNSIIKAANESLFRPAAVQLVQEVHDAEALGRAASGVFTGGQAAVAQIGEETGHPQLGREIAAAPEAFMGTPHPTGMPGAGVAEMGRVQNLEAMEAEVAKAKSLGVIGAGEDGYFGTAPSQPAPPISAPQAPAAKPAAGMPVDLFVEPRDTGEAPKAEAAKVEAAPEPGLPETQPAAAAPAEAKANPIAEDIAAKLIAAGRPEEEARASADLIASHYEARAERFGGQRGTAQDMYAADSADIRSSNGAAPTKSEPTKPTEGDTGSATTPARNMDAAAAWYETGLDATDRELWRTILERKLEKNGELTFSDVPRDLTDKMHTNTIVGLKDALANDPHGALEALSPKRKPTLGDTGAAEPTPPETPPLSGGAAEPVTTIPELKKALRGRAAADPAKWSLYEFLAKEGGLKPTGDLKSILGGKNPFVPGFGPLLRESGLSMDEALTRAKESGYILDPNDIQHVPGATNKGELTKTVNDLQDMVAAESRGQKQYRTDHVQPEAKVNPDEERGAIVDELHRQVKETGGNTKEIDPAIEDRVVEMVQKGQASDVMDAFERAQMEVEYNQKAAAASLNDVRAAWDAKGIKGDIHENAGTITVSRIIVPKEQRGQGIGTAAMRELTDYADANGKRIVLSPSTDFGGTKSRLVNFYKSLGFEENKGRNKDFTTRETMIRAPQRTLDQIKRGKINFRKDQKPIITLFKDANASTFIHETGHQWLEELMADSEHPQAPADLKADAVAVLDWLGVKTADQIKTSHHEKFARGFERYMMEGKAPNQALASVFARFKDWLTKIYQTVTRLKSPINDEIRGVFDRLLTLHPGDVKIEPETPAKTFADIHEADAAATPPEMAHPAAETIQGERDTVAARHIPEDNNARLENTPDQARRSEAGNTQSASDTTASGTQPGEGGSAEASGTVGAGGIETPTAGPRTPASTRTEPPQSPHDQFPEKAGNIRLDNLNTPEDLNAIIRQTAEDNGDFQNVRGPVSDAQVLDLAEAAGVDAAFIDSRKLGEAWTAPQIVALRRLLIQSAQSVHDLAMKAAAGTDADVIAYAEAKARHQLIQERVSSVTAEAGRALRAFQAKFTEGVAGGVNAYLKDATGKTLFQLQQEAKFLSKLQTPQQTSKFVNDTSKGTFRNAILEYYINALISGPVTHSRYIVSNAVNAIFTPLVEIPFGAMAGKVHEIVSGKPADGLRFGESGAQLYGLIKGSRDGLSAAIEAFKTGVSPALPTEKMSPHFAQASQAIPGKVGQVLRIPSRSVAGIHSFFKAVRYEQNVQALAYREAANEGLRGDAFTNRVAELTTNPTEAMMANATSNALKELYMSPTEYHSKMGGLVRFTNQNLAAKIVVPFMKIGSQITRNAFMERTPLGLLDKKVRASLSGELGGGERDLQAGKITAGVALMATSVGLMAEGMMTGDGPEDPAKRAVWLLSHTPASIQIGDINFKYGNTGPLGMLMRFAANTYETAEHMGDKDMATLAVSFFEGFAKSVLDETFLRGVKDMLDAMFHPKEYGGRYLKSQITNWIPWSVGLSQVARKVDPFSRETHGIWQAAQAKIPYLSQSLMPRRDMFGEPIPNGAPLPNYANDPVVKAMDDLHIGVGKIGKKIRGIDLTEQQYDDLARIAGRMAKTRLNAQIGIISNPQIPAAQRVEMIHTTIANSREAARSLILMQSVNGENDIMAKARAAKLSQLQAR